MNNFSFETETATEFIEQALNDFLRDKKLQLTPQQYNKLKKLLMVRLLDEEISYTNAYNHLSDLVEYRKDYEINANAPDEAEEEMIRIIGAADTKEVEVSIETNRFKKRFITTTILLGLVCATLLTMQAIQYFKTKQAEQAAIITTAEENQIKELVAQIVELEKLKGNEITAASVYNKIKKLESVKAYGPATSYKKFNRAQHAVTIEFLEKWSADITPPTNKILK